MRRDDMQPQLRIPAARLHPGDASVRVPQNQRAQGMPGAGRTRSLVCRMEKSIRA